MKIINIASVGIISVAILALVLRISVVKIKPGETGVLNKQWGGGLQEEDYSPGYYLALGPLHTWKVMDTTVQTLNMLRPTQGKVGNSVATSFPALKVKSRDGADVTLDITIKYRIKQGGAWQIVKEQGAGDGYKTRVFSLAKQSLFSGLGKLSTEEFFDPTKRTETQDLMTGVLGPLLDKIHVDLIAILIRDLEFQASFQAKINAKTLTKQKAELQIAMTKAAKQLGKTNEIRAESTARVKVIERGLEKTITELEAENDKKVKKIVADYEKYVTETRSKAALYGQQKDAEGIKLTKDAEARGQALKRQALSTEGGRVLVALRVVENLKLGDIAISTQLVNPLDLAEMMKRLGASK